jgi:hypothetical protein
MQQPEPWSADPVPCQYRTCKNEQQAKHDEDDKQDVQQQYCIGSVQIKGC